MSVSVRRRTISITLVLGVVYTLLVSVLQLNLVEQQQRRTTPHHVTPMLSLDGHGETPMTPLKREHSSEKGIVTERGYYNAGKVVPLTREDEGRDKDTAGRFDKESRGNNDNNSNNNNINNNNDNNNDVNDNNNDLTIQRNALSWHSVFLRKLKEAIQTRHHNTEEWPHPVDDDHNNNNDNDSMPTSSSGHRQGQGQTEEVVTFHKLTSSIYVYEAWLDHRGGDGPWVKLFVLRSSAREEDNVNIVCVFNTTNDYDNNQNENGNNNEFNNYPRRKAATRFRSNLRTSDAVPHEMCENHDKKFGGWIYFCRLPKQINGLKLDTISVGIEKRESEEKKEEGGEEEDVLTNSPFIANIPLRQIAIPPSPSNKRKQIMPDSGYGISNNNRNHTPNLDPPPPSSSERNRDRTIEEPNRKPSNSQDTNSKMSSSSSSSFHSESNDDYDYVTDPNTQRSNSSSNIGVCVPPLYGHVNLQRIISFVELCRVLGAGEIFMYINDISKDLAQLVQEYSDMPNSILSLVKWHLPSLDTGFNGDASPDDLPPPERGDSSAATSFSYTLPPSQVLWNRGQLLAIQHCLYTNMLTFDWLLFLDIDEILIPRKSLTWQGLLHDQLPLHTSPHSHTTSSSSSSLSSSSSSSLSSSRGNNSNNNNKNNKTISGLSFDSAMFYIDAGSQARYSVDYFQKLRRGRRTDKTRRKVFVRADKIAELGIHHVSRLMDETADSVVNVDQEEALIHHYRSETGLSFGWPDDRSDDVFDDTALRYRTELVSATRLVRNYLGHVMSIKAKGNKRRI